MNLGEEWNNTNENFNKEMETRKCSPEVKMDNASDKYTGGEPIAD